MTLFRPTYRLLVQNAVGHNELAQAVEYTEHDIDFSVHKSLDKEPNKIKVSVYNPNKDDLVAIEALNLYDPRTKKPSGIDQRGGYLQKDGKKKGPRAAKKGNIGVLLEAGFGDRRSVIFEGDLRFATHSRDGADVKLEISGEDAGVTTQESRINQSFASGVSRLKMVKACLDAMGVGYGNLKDFEPMLLAAYPKPQTLNGGAYAALNRLLAGTSLKASVQHGVFQLHSPGRPLGDSGYVISSDSGMVGEPKRDAHGAIHVDTLMLFGLAPGASVRLEAHVYSGDYYVHGMEIKGSTQGTDWGYSLELVEI